MSHLICKQGVKDVDIQEYKTLIRCHQIKLFFLHIFLIWVCCTIATTIYHLGCYPTLPGIVRGLLIFRNQVKGYRALERPCWPEQCLINLSRTVCYSNKTIDTLTGCQMVLTPHDGVTSRRNDKKGPCSQTSSVGGRQGGEDRGERKKHKPLGGKKLHAVFGLTMIDKISSFPLSFCAGSLIQGDGANGECGACKDPIRACRQVFLVISPSSPAAAATTTTLISC